VRAMGIEVVRYLARAGVLAEGPPGEGAPGLAQPEEQ
jgi:hypothetical protein